MSSQEPHNGALPHDTAQPEGMDAGTQAERRPGARLMAERRAQGLSLGDVARQLKLSVRQVEALERDEYDAFPGPVFVRGFLRNYAKLLQLEPEALVAQAGLGGPAPAAVAPPATGSAPTTPVPLQEPRARRRSRFGFGTLALAAVLVVLVVAAVYDASNKPAPVALTPPPAPAVTQAPAPQHPDSPPPAVPVTAAVPAPGAADAASMQGSSVPGAAPATAAAGAAEPAPASPSAAPPSSAAEIRLTFDGESWVEIKDATGTVIFSRLNSAGSEQALSGEPPLELVVGNAGSVRLTYRGKPVDLTPHTRVDVARLRLD